MNHLLCKNQKRNMNSTNQEVAQEFHDPNDPNEEMNKSNEKINDVINKKLDLINIEKNIEKYRRVEGCTCDRCNTKPPHTNPNPPPTNPKPPPTNPKPPNLKPPNPKPPPPPPHTHTHTHLYKKYEIIYKNISIISKVSKKHSCRLSYGRTQSGKTYETYIEMVNTMKIEKSSSIFFTRDYKSDCIEINRKINGYNECNKDKIIIKKINSSSSKKEWQEVADSMKTNYYDDDKKLIFWVIMCNKTTMKKILNGFKNNDEIKYIIGLDEADIYISDNDTNQMLIKYFLDGALCKYFISATLLDVKKLIKDDDIVKSIPTIFAFDDKCEDSSTFYRSLHNVVHHEEIKCDTEEEYLKQVIKKSIDEEWSNEYIEKEIGYSMMFFNSVKNEVNSENAKKISKHKYEGYSVVSLTYNQEGSYIYENGNRTLMENVYHNEKKEIIKLKKSEIKNYVEISAFSIAISNIKKRQINGEKIILCIFGGHLLARSFSVTDIDYVHYIGCMIYNMNENSDASLIVQRMGRLCGTSDIKNKCTQRIFSTRQNFNRAKDCTEYTSNMVKTLCENPTEEISEVIKKINVKPRKSKKCLSLFKIEKKFKVDKNIETIHKSEHIPYEDDNEDDNEDENNKNKSHDKIYKLCIPPKCKEYITETQFIEYYNKNKFKSNSNGFIPKLLNIIREILPNENEKIIKNINSGVWPKVKNNVNINTKGLLITKINNIYAIRYNE